MFIRELFLADVTRDIPPVVYFHEQSPQKLQGEVSEYIITGGYPEGDPRARRVKSGIHEQFVHLLQQIHREIERKGGPELPNCWISGFYGSGKSSFAKLLGLSLDGTLLPDGKALSAALLERDDSPRRKELDLAWEALTTRVSERIAVVFDIGAVARDGEHIHAAVLRQLQARLGYSSKSDLVAEHELKLERDGEWTAFVKTAQKVLGRPWEEAKEDEQVEDHFSHVLHVMNPERYLDPMSWIDSRAGGRAGKGGSVTDAAKAVEAMLAIRAPGKALFLVVDEVSQYIHQVDDRMEKLRAFASEIGSRFKGAVWLLVTGQQKLDESGDNTVLHKLKDRFPPSLRVHLDPANIRDVVHKRLLKKDPKHEPTLRELFQRHRADLKLYAYGCEEITEEDFVEVYPMLPGHVDLLMRITSNLRSRSTRIQGDDHAIRGLLQLLGELFREQKLGARPVGDLVTIDSIYEVQHSALDADVQTTLARVWGHPDVRDDALAMRVAKAVALLEQIQEKEPTTPELVASCLYARLGEGNQVSAVAEALDRLRSASLLSYSEKQGYKIQSSAGQEWNHERERLPVTGEQVSEIVRDKLKELLATPDRPRLKGRPFPWSAWYSDGREATDVRLQDPRDEAAVTVDYRYLGAKEDRASTDWIRRSDQEALRDRIVWVVGEPGRIGQLARELCRARHMVRMNEPRKESLPREKQRLLIEEQARAEDLEVRVRDSVAEAFFDGSLYFRGRTLRPQDLGGAFGTALNAAASRILPDLFPHFTEIAVTETELNQLLEPTLSGPSTKFLEGGLGILSLDAGKYVASCAGAEPTRLLQFIVESGGASGATVIARFSRPPYGYPTDVVRACLAGLLRATKIRIRPESGPELTSIKDPGTKDLFRKDRDLRRADLFPPKDQAITARDRVAICSFFKKHFDLDLERENDAIADTVFQTFPKRRDALREVEKALDRLPGRPALPEALQKLGKALEDCCRSRQVEDIVVAAKRHLDVLADGIEQLGIYASELGDMEIEAVRRAAAVRDHHLSQLEHAGEVGEAEADATRLVMELKSERPWRAVAALSASSTQVGHRYAEVRKALLTAQSSQVEAARGRLKGRAGFERLSADESHRVLRPFAEALFDTTAEATSPTLVEIRDRFLQKLDAADEKANDVLDEILSRETATGTGTGTGAGTGAGTVPAARRAPAIVKVDTRLTGREIASKEQLEAVLSELRERVSAQLDKGARVRLV